MAGPLVGLKVLVVEDNYLVASFLENLLISAGCVVSGPIPRRLEACDAATREACDAALLDVHLGGGEGVYPVADILSRRNVPYLFVTGYSGNALPPEYAERPRIAKPFKTKELLGALSNLIKPANGSGGAAPPIRRAVLASGISE